MKTQHIVRLAVAAAGAAALLAACGGGGPVAVAPPLVAGSMVPVSATTSSGGAIDFVSSLVTPGGNNGEPLELGAAQLATSDTAEPNPI